MVFNREILKKIEMIFGIVILIVVMKSATEMFVDLQKEKEFAFAFQNIFFSVGLFLSCILVGVMHYIYLVIIFIAIKLASRSSYKKILDETDFEKNKNYYRDIIKDYSASELNYIDKFKLDKKQSYTAKLLELEKKKIIKIEKDKILKISNPDNIIDEKFVDSIKNNKITMTLSEYESLVEKEALEHGLITKSSIFGKFKDKKVIAIMAIVFVLMYAYLFWSASIQGAGNVEETLFLAIVWLIVIASIVFAFIIVFSISYHLKNAVINKYTRTDMGKKINLQLDGLKSFMDDLSNIDSKEAKYLALWDEYLIYSVMFDINKKIQNEYSKFFN